MRDAFDDGFVGRKALGHPDRQEQIRRWDFHGPRKPPLLPVVLRREIADPKSLGVDVQRLHQIADNVNHLSQPAISASLPSARRQLDRCESRGPATFLDQTTVANHFLRFFLLHRGERSHEDVMLGLIRQIILTGDFEEQMTIFLREYKGDRELLSPHAPDETGSPRRRADGWRHLRAWARLKGMVGDIYSPETLLEQSNCGAEIKTCYAVL